MSEEINHNKRLKDLLSKHLEQTGRDADAFEQEALEGFAMLKNEEEAMDLKKSVDARIYSEVFAEKKQESRRFYWLAAAVLIGVIGMSIYLFQTYFTTPKTELAIQTPKTVPMKENSVPEAPSPAQTNSPEPEGATEIKPIKQVQIDKSIHSSSVENEGQKFMEDLSDQSNVAPASAPASEIPEREQEVKALPVSDQTKASNPKESSRSAAEPLAAKEEIVAKKSKSKVSEDVLSKASDESIEIATVSTKPSPSCTFKGGNQELKKQLKDQLKQKNLLYPFDATLFLNKKGKIEKVLIKNSDGLNEEDQQKVIEVIKQLNDFKVSGLKGKEIIQYNIEFRP